MKIVNYLDVSFNLSDGSFRPYRKPNDEIQYIHVDSDHPPSIIKQLPLSVEKRLSTLSSSKEIFDESATIYQEALNKSGYSYELKFNQNSMNNRPINANRKRKIIWFNPPFSKSVITNVGRRFLNLIDKHFPPHHKFRKLFNRNTVKISYSCMTNMKNKINQHNRQVIHNITQPTPTNNVAGCNCLDGNNCPLDGKCLEKDILYLGVVKSDIRNYNEKIYKLCSTSFKYRYANHKKSFNHEKYKTDTELSKEVWELKDINGNPDVKWNIFGKFSAYNPASHRCNLCLNEKLEISIHKEDNLLNKRSEVISQCRHKNKFKLKNLKDNIT